LLLADSGLTKNACQRFRVEFLGKMSGNCDAALLSCMFELPVTPSLPNEILSTCFDTRDHVPDFHQYATKLRY
jgi:hypothetical protein